MIAYIEKLLKGQPVEWQTLGEVAEIGTGSSNRQDEVENGKYPFYVRSKSILRSSTYQFDETAIIIPGEGGIGDIYHFINGKYALHQRAYRIHLQNDNLLDKFVYHYMRTHFKRYILSKSVGATATSIRKPMLETFSVPIPPLNIQAEIVRILDIFTELEAELEAELDCRKRQYDYYRNHLLSYEGNEVEWKTLGEVVKTTKNIKWQNNENTYDYIDLTSVCRETGNVLETLKIKADNAPSRAQKMVQLDDVIFATTRPSQMRIALIPKKFDGQIASTGYCILRADKVNVLPKWIFFTLSTTEFKKFVAENQSGTAYPAISDSKLKEFKIPLPPLSEQQRIVGILDKFDTLVHSISEGLPREIELRKKQYEYYREQLLSFPEYKVTA